jgi:hypothetical protein
MKMFPDIGYGLCDWMGEGWREYLYYVVRATAGDGESIRCRKLGYMRNKCRSIKMFDDKTKE